MASRVSSHSIRITADQQAAQATSRNVRRALSTSFPIEIAKEFAKITKQIREEMQAMAKAQQAMARESLNGITALTNAIQKLGQAQRSAVGIPQGLTPAISIPGRGVISPGRSPAIAIPGGLPIVPRLVPSQIPTTPRAPIQLPQGITPQMPPRGGGPVPPGQIPAATGGGGGGPIPPGQTPASGGGGGSNPTHSAGVAAGNQFRKTFMAGFLQGVGLADYIPSNDSLKMRTAGIVTGRAIHRAGTIAASPFLNPGISGLTQALGGIPLVGGMAAGALNAISGMYGRAAGYDQARLANLYLMGGDPLSQGRALISGRPIIEAEAQKIEAAAKRKVQTAQQILAMQRGSTRSQNLVRLAQQGNTSAQHVLSNMRMANTLHLLGSMSGANATNPYVRSSVPIDSADIKKEEQNLASAQNYLLKATGDAAKYRQQAMGRLFGHLFGGDKIGAGFGVPYGMAPEAVQSFLGQYYGARGGDLQEPGTRGRVRQAMIAQTLFGVGAQLSGGFGRADLTGARTDRGGMLNILASAVLQGLRGSQIQEYLQEMVNQGRTAEQQGIKINQDDFARQTSFLSKYVGLNPVQATRIGGGLRGVTQQIGAQGIQTPQQYLMLRAAGFDPSQGRAGYLRAIEGIEGGLDAEGMQRLMGMITQGTGGLEGATPDDTRRMQLLGIKRFFSAVGIPIGFEQAEKLYKTFAIKGPPTSMEAYQEALAPLGAKGIMGQLDVAARGKAGAFAPLAVTQAGMGAEQIKIGREMADTFTKLNKIGLTMADTLTNFKDGLDAIVKLMDMLSKTLNKTTKGGFGGITKRLLGITP